MGENSQNEYLLCFAFDRVGRNVAAGMTGGLAYILDEDDTLIPKVRTNHLREAASCFSIHACQ